jgi:hypothetical protein
MRLLCQPIRHNSAFCMLRDGPTDHSANIGSRVRPACQSLRSAYSFESTLSPRSAAILIQRVS